ncbi:hypothetical protein GFD17_05265 [Bifidobacterium sp. SMB2]|uniref:Secreted protein n=1 Tax=Bifidobacterium saimiriisciurei TaxID=2661627 RepID=A0ABX0C6H9_9BIFI|nr:MULTISPECIES: hypothetical protein [Bifidobacterium]NEG96174.1 hypothetical protein [Bifidobacterium sp. SMB2]NEH10748.1 hypothetical protein [Bifidobacterium saimiriisciurei]
MFKRLFWISVGVITGIMAVTKAQAYVKAHTPEPARTFVFGPDEEKPPVTLQTVQALFADFERHRHAREEELNRQFIAKTER